MYTMKKARKYCKKNLNSVPTVNFLGTLNKYINKTVATYDNAQATAQISNWRLTTRVTTPAIIVIKIRLNVRK